MIMSGISLDLILLAASWVGVFVGGEIKVSLGVISRTIQRHQIRRDSLHAHEDHDMTNYFSFSTERPTTITCRRNPVQPSALCACSLEFKCKSVVLFTPR